MRSFRSVFLWIFGATFIGVFLFRTFSAYANIAGNPSFEVPIGSGTEGNWDSTNGSVRTDTVPAGFSAFPNGSFALVQDATSDFTFQTIRTDIEPGDLVVFSAQVESDVGAGSGGQLRIEFQRVDPSTGLVILISDVLSALINTGNAPAGGGYVTFTISGRAPQDINRVTFTLRRQGAGAGTVVFDNVNAEINPGKLTLAASKTEVKPGDLVTIVADFHNASAQAQTNVELKVEVPSGLDIIEHTIRNNGSPTTVREGSFFIFSTNSLNANDNVRIVFQVLVTAGVSLGKIYEIEATVFASGKISQVGHVILRTRGDPLFDEGTVLGKVFDDRNEDGEQQKGEIGVPAVRLYTEYGVSVVTDSDGRFHIPAVKPGRHVVKIDGHTLPEGTRFLTEESLLIKTTPGLLNKIRFAVFLPESALPEEFKKDLQVWVTQGVDLTPPQLQVHLTPEILKLGLGRLEREPVFKIKTNYGEFIAGWRLVVINEMGEKIWTGLGIGEPPTEIPWTGLLDNGEMIRAGTYAYRLIVRDAKDHEDWTPLYFFHVLRKAETFETGEKPMDIPGVGAFNIFRDGRRGIPLVAQPMVRVHGKTEAGRRVTVGKMPVEVGPTGEFEQEFFVKPGEKKIVVNAANSEGDTVSVEERMTVKDSQIFLVALGEEEMGVNFMKGNVETSGRDDEFHEGFYQEGRLSYYLKGKIKGKFLVKSRYDTADKRAELFTSLDPDDYYPVYGDQSQIEYEGQETRERLFLLVEMGRSFLKWGSYHTDFTDTELSRYNRTLSGLKIHHEALSSTKYGDSKRGFTVYWSKPSYLADHNEFRGTGGSLYYLKNRNMLSGSEKLRVETRDKITDIPIESRDLIAWKDYEVDYRQGRILLKEPLSSVAASQTIISNDILDGNPVYLIVDYEYESFRMFEETVAGIRGYTHIGDYLRIGGTAIEEQRGNSDYDLRGVDAVIRAGRNTKVTLEIAQSKLQQVKQATSFNGGLSFHNQSPFGVRRPRETAYLIKAESKPVEALELSGYIQNIQPGFSVDRIASQEGYRKHGLQARLKLTNAFYLLGRHDVTDVASQIRPLPAHGIFATFEQIRSTTVQAVYDQGPWKIIGEYLYQHLDIPIQNRIDSLFSEMPFRNAFGAKVGRRVTDSLMPYVKAQYAYRGVRNFQVGGGLEAKFKENTKVFFEQMFGEPGDATVLGVSHNRDEKTTSYATIKVRDSGLGRRQVSTSVGSSHQLSERSRIYSEREYSAYSGNVPLSLAPSFFDGTAEPGLWSSDIYGYETQFWERWDAGIRFERRRLDSDDFRNLNDEAVANLTRTNHFNTLALSLGYTDPEKIKAASAVEVRIEPEAPETRQWVTQNSFEWRINRDLSFLGRTNFGTSRFLDTNNLTGRFLELNTGFAYRPVETDRLNWLARYTFFSEEASDAQFAAGSNSGTIEVDERAHILALEGGYELNRYLQIVDKAAYRLGDFKTAVTDWTKSSALLFVHRFNYHITRKWDLGLEYRVLLQAEAANNLRHGPLVEIDREFYDYIRLGIGYNFTDFDDDLRNVNDFRKNSIFFRVTGKV